MHLDAVVIYLLLKYCLHLMKKSEINEKNLNKLLDEATDSYNCNMKEKNVFKCFEELDKKILFKKRKYQKCLELQKEFQHCLIYSNEINIHKRQAFKGEINQLEILNKNQEWKLQNKMEAYQFTEGKKTEEEILNKPDNPNARKKIVEL
jgi:hypothetical protein